MILSSNRLQLRPVTNDDKESIYLYRSDPETSKYLSLLPDSTEEIAEFINNTSNEINIPGSWFQFAIVEKTSKTIIGDIGIHFLDNDSDNNQVEIGYTLSRNFRGKGYATEALKVVIDYLFSALNKHRIVASIDPLNKNSIKLIERLGFRKEAHFKESLFFRGKWVDDVVYAILKKEWTNK